MREWDNGPVPLSHSGGSQLVFNGAVLGIISSIYKKRDISPISNFF